MSQNSIQSPWHPDCLYFYQRPYPNLTLRFLSIKEKAGGIISFCGITRWTCKRFYAALFNSALQRDKSEVGSRRDADAFME